MTRILTIVALLFATPAWAANEVCQVTIESGQFLQSDIDRANETINSKNNDCDTLWLKLSGDLWQAHWVAKFCDMSKSVYVDEMKDRTHIACVPAK